MSKFCPSCGEELVDNAKFCKNCGMNLETKETQETQQTNTIQQPTQTYEVPKVENDHKLAIIAGYVLAILIPIIGLIIGIYLMTRKDSEKASFHGKLILGLAVIIWFISFLLMMN